MDRFDIGSSDAGSSDVGLDASSLSSERTLSGESFGGSPTESFSVLDPSFAPFSSVRSAASGAFSLAFSWASSVFGFSRSDESSWSGSMSHRPAVSVSVGFSFDWFSDDPLTAFASSLSSLEVESPASGAFSFAFSCASCLF